MFRPGRNPKDQPGSEHPSEQPQTATSAFGNAAADAQSRNTQTADQYSSTGARNMSETQPTTTRAVSESESLARDIKEGTLSGFVGNGTTLTGEANFKGMLRVDGHLSGRVSSQDGTLIVSTGGQVDADVAVSVAQIYGTVIGNITATKRIELGRVAKVTGDIQTPALVIEQGAVFEGSCRMQQIKDAQAKEDGRAASSGSATTGTSSPAATTSGATAKPSDGAGATSGATSATGATTGAPAKTT
ncbi:MAG TPA: polymer-forming cytoskeletal protein [Pyrinomonadaceae bacterium]|nr:polymer-forming cytoskeletal protein [Pyrinomonadaceae bacterium]